MLRNARGVGGGGGGGDDPALRSVTVVYQSKTIYYQLSDRGATCALA